MPTKRLSFSVVTACAVALVLVFSAAREPPLARVATAITATQPASDPLPSWNDGSARTALLQFVARVTQKDGPDFVPVAERIATFDNDGPLGSEQPLYTQVVLALDRVKALAPKHSDWSQKQPCKGVLERAPSTKHQNAAGSSST